MTMPTIPTPPAAPAPTPEEIYAQQVEAFSDASFAHLSGDALTQAITNMQEAAQDAVDEAARLQTKINADVVVGTQDPDDVPAMEQEELNGRFFGDVAQHALDHHPELNQPVVNASPTLRERYDGLSNVQRIGLGVVAAAGALTGFSAVFGDDAPLVDPQTGLTVDGSQTDPPVTMPGSPTAPEIEEGPQGTVPPGPAATPETSVPNTMPPAGPETMTPGEEVPPAVDDIIFCGPDGKVVSVESPNDGVIVQSYSGDPCVYPGAGQQAPSGDDLIIGR